MHIEYVLLRPVTLKKNVKHYTFCKYTSSICVCLHIQHFIVGHFGLTLAISYVYLHFIQIYSHMQATILPHSICMQVKKGSEHRTKYTIKYKVHSIRYN